MLRVGVVSDTHGRVLAEVHTALAGVSHILHAGDVGGSAVLVELATIAPVTAVRGNCDRDELAFSLPERAFVRLGGVGCLVGHVRGRLLARGLPDDVGVVVTGHTHVASVRRENGVLHVNPGPATGASRNGQGPSVAILEVADDGTVMARIVPLRG